MANSGFRRNIRPQGAVQRRFEIFACEAWYDAEGNTLQVDHSTVAVMNLEPDDRALNAQRTFDEFLEEQLFWDHHLNSPEAEEHEQDAEF